MDTLAFISDICGALKNIKRTGWVRSGVPLPESDADHMHRCAICALLVTDDTIDKIKLLRMALTHDLCEALAGDITPYCKEVDSRHEKEQRAMQEIRKLVGGPLGLELYNLWKEYEDLKTPEAIYCKDIDKFEMVLQAYEYEKAHLKNKKDASQEEQNVENQPLRGFFVSTNATMKTSLFRRLDKELREKREGMLIERGWEVTDDEQQKALKRPLDDSNVEKP
jgi:putative hydrolase of HD superfamily